MTDSAAEFFDGLQRQGHIPLMEKVNGTLRFDVKDGKRTGHWFVTIKKGDVTVTHSGNAADCVVKADKEIVEGISSGSVNAFAAVLRGEIEVEGDREMMVLFQRVLPGPGGEAARAEAAQPVGSRS
jgi:putative sterol carrier protein